MREPRYRPSLLAITDRDLVRIVDEGERWTSDSLRAGDCS
jgi:hypothetical protein